MGTYYFRDADPETVIKRTLSLSYFINLDHFLAATLSGSYAPSPMYLQKLFLSTDEQYRVTS